MLTEKLGRPNEGCRFGVSAMDADSDFTFATRGPTPLVAQAPRESAACLLDVALTVDALAAVSASVQTRIRDALLRIGNNAGCYWPRTWTGPYQVKMMVSCFAANSVPS